MSTTPAADSPAETIDVPTSRGLFAGFFKVGVQGFGGVMPFARRMLVEDRRWLSEQEFLDVLSLSQFLPGPNIVNVSIIVGRRFRGAVGSVVACVGLLAMPFAIVLALAALYARFVDLAPVRGAATGVSAAASGLILSMALKLSRPLRDSAWQIAIGIIAFVGIGLVRLPLLWLLVVLAPMSIAIAWWRRA